MSTSHPTSVSGKYRNDNLPPPTYLHHATVYVLSYEGSAWPERETYDGILGAYVSLAHAQTAGTRWLREARALRADGVVEARVSGWVGKGEGEWEKEKAVVGEGFLEARVVRVKRCAVRMDSSLAKDTENRGGDDGRGEEEEEGGAVEEAMERLAV